MQQTTMQKTAETSYPLDKLLRERWSPRAFSDRLVTDEHLGSLLEAARWAPSSSNDQPWFFILAQKQNKEEFEKAVACLNPRNQTWASGAPVLLFAVARTNFDNQDKPNRHAPYDLGQAVAHLSIEATALGLQVHQMAGISADKVRETYAVPPNYEIFTGIAIAYLGNPQTLPEDLQQKEAAPRKRKPLDSFVFSGKWGQPPAFLAQKP
jgi:nitroreductase